MTAIYRNRRRAIIAVGAVTALLAVPGVPALANGQDNNPQDKQTICHRTDSNTNPYQVKTPNKDGDLSGHADHTGPVWNPTLKSLHLKWGDIIPSFTYNDDGDLKTFPGLNWNANGQAWFNNGCRVPITVTVDKTNNANGDSAFSADETSMFVGAAVPFKVVVTNTSIVPAVVESFVDKVSGTPLSITPTPDIVGTTLVAGESVTVMFTVPAYTPADGQSKVNDVTVVLNQACPSKDGEQLSLSDKVDGCKDNSGTATASSTVRTVVPPPDVSITKTGPATVAPGDNLTWTLTVRNDGLLPVSGVVVTDSLPAGTTLVSAGGTGWTTTGTTSLTFTLDGSMAVGATSTLTIVVTLDPAYAGTTVSNTSVVTPKDATPADNTATATTAVTQSDVSIVKTGPATAAPGDTLTWTLTVHNDGTIPARGVVVTDTLPVGTTLVSATGAGWTTAGTTTAAGTTTVTATLGSNLAVGATSTLTIVASLDPAFPLAALSNTAVVAPDDVTPADNTSTLTTTMVTGGGGGTTTPTPTASAFTGGGGGVQTGTGGKGLPFTGLPVGFMLAGALALLLSGLGLVLLTPRGRHS